MALFDFLTGGRPVDRFAKQVVGEIRRQSPGTPAAYDARQLTITTNSGGTGYVGNVFEDYQRSDAPERARIIVDYARMLLTPDEDPAEMPFETIKAQLRPAIKSMSYILHALKLDGESGPRLPYRAIAGPLCAIIVIDSPRSMFQVSQAHLDAWGVPFDDALGIAIENLRGESPLKFRREAGGFHVSDYGDYFDASRLLLPHLFEQLSLKGDPVAIAIDRSLLVVCGSDEPEVLREMASVAEATVDNQHRAIAYTPIVLKNGAWEVMSFDPLSCPELERLRIKQVLWDAREQKAVLDATFERDGVDVFVGELMVHEHEGRPYTFTTLSSKSVLPRADVICMTGPGGEGMLPRRWEEVEAVAGPFALQPDTYPPFYAVDVFSNPTLEHLRDHTACPDAFQGFATDRGWVRITPERRR